MKFRIQADELVSAKRELDRHVKSRGKTYKVYVDEQVTISTVNESVRAEYTIPNAAILEPGMVMIKGLIFDALAYLEYQPLVIEYIHPIIKVSGEFNGEFNTTENDPQLEKDVIKPSEWFNVPATINHIFYASDGEFPFVYTRDGLYTAGNRLAFAGTTGPDIGERTIQLDFLKGGATKIGFVDKQVWISHNGVLATAPEGSSFNQFIIRLGYPLDLGEIYVKFKKQDALHWLGLSETLSQSTELGGDGRVTVKTIGDEMHFIPNKGEISSGTIKPIKAETHGEFEFYTSTKALITAINNADSDRPSLYMNHVDTRPTGVIVGEKTRHMLPAY